VVVKTRDGFSMNAYLTLHLARRSTSQLGSMWFLGSRRGGRRIPLEVELAREGEGMGRGERGQ
jgi:hypothetical protein